MLNPTESDILTEKTFPNSFWQTNLESLLKSLGVEEVLVCGCFNMACVFQTHNGALERGFSSSILDGGTITSREETNDWLRALTDFKRIDEMNL